MGTALGSVLLRDQARQYLVHIASQPRHGILLYGQAGVGLYTIGYALARDMTDHDTSIVTITPDEKGTIGISSVQNIYHTVKTKSASRKVVLIDNADAMSIEAQNAFLKVLEEPPKNHTFILTSHSEEKLLPTITSRVQSFLIGPLSHSNTDKLLAASSVDSTKSAQIRFLSSGLPAEMKRLISDDDYFLQNVAMMTQARRFLQGTPYERLQETIKVSNDRSRCEQFISMVIALSEFSFGKQPSVQSIESMELLNDSLAAIRANGNIKLQMSHLSLSLK